MAAVRSLFSPISQLEVSVHIWWNDVEICWFYAIENRFISISIIIYSVLMDLSRPPSSIFPTAGGGIVLPRHPATPSNISPPTKVSTPSNGATNNAKTAFFSISNLVNGLRQQQQDDNETSSKGRIAIAFASPPISPHFGQIRWQTIELSKTHYCQMVTDRSRSLQ